MDKSLKTCLRYPGGKSKAVKKMLPYFPDFSNINWYIEPFLGGGSVALEVFKRHSHLKIWVNDLYFPLYNFWLQLQVRPQEMTKNLIDLKTQYNDPLKAKVLFEDCKKELTLVTGTAVDKAIAFYIVNKCSFSGLTESSSFSASASESNFSLRGIEKLPAYSELIQGWSITNWDYKELLEGRSKNTFIYLDPPYEISSNLYGKKGNMHSSFDHDDFARECNKLKSPTLISYNADDSIKDRFPDWEQIEYSHTYTMRSNSANYRKNQPHRKELLLRNYK